MAFVTVVDVMVAVINRSPNFKLIQIWIVKQVFEAVKGSNSI